MISRMCRPPKPCLTGGSDVVDLTENYAGDSDARVMLSERGNFGLGV